MPNVLLRHQRPRKPTRGIRCRLRTLLNTSPFFKAGKYGLDERRQLGLNLEKVLVLEPRTFSYSEAIKHLQEVLPFCEGCFKFEDYSVVVLGQKRQHTLEIDYC